MEFLGWSHVKVLAGIEVVLKGRSSIEDSTHHDFTCEDSMKPCCFAKKTPSLKMSFWMKNNTSSVGIGTLETLW